MRFSTAVSISLAYFTVVSAVPWRGHHHHLPSPSGNTPGLVKTCISNPTTSPTVVPVPDEPVPTTATSTVVTEDPVPPTSVPSSSDGSSSPVPSVPSGSTDAPAPSDTEVPQPDPQTTATPAGSVVPVPPADPCTCGYKLQGHGDAYFPKAFNADFSGLSGVATSPEFLGGALYITNGWQAGAVAADGTVPIGEVQNIRVNNGILELVVPGGQTAGGNTTVAQIEGPVVIAGVFTMETQIDPTPGTCQSIFTYHTQETGTDDEQDIEILSSYLFEAGDNGTPPGIELTNYNPSGGGNDNTIVPYPDANSATSPTSAFHNYTIAWIPATGTRYYYDNQALNGPTKYTSANPSSIILNHWTNGDHGFTQGPPAQEAVMRVKRVTGFYAAPGETEMPAGCSEADVCVV
ncbi:hypothetical protein BKA62DRAFT_17326 [Auriculariales sp. MPI-PUGE-AT-0066]|nr:hypothetical protein BKA62DRAFT_17326 [Auriculariales sp. MPI-PUGE-AT-0066]